MVRFKYSISNVHAIQPIYSTEGSAGMDLCSVEMGTIRPGERRLVKTGLIFAIPEGYELQVRSRSGLAFKQGIIVLNSPGTIDSDYRGEVMVMLHNVSSEIFFYTIGDRIAQGVLAKVERADFELCTADQLSTTERGSGGFGSTGIKSVP